ncbi:MAG: cellulose binding domain-containing protein [Bacillota bacterium]
MRRIRTLITLLLVFSLMATSSMVSFDSVSAASSLKVQFFNQVRDASSSNIYANFKVINTGDTAIDLTGVKLRYYFTADGSTQPLNFFVDHATVGSSNVTGAFYSITNATNADRYVEISFKSGSLVPYTGEVVVQSRIARADYTNFDQSNDYSFNPNASYYTDWSYVIAYFSGTLAWGTPPGLVQIQNLSSVEVDAVSVKLKWTPLTSTYGEMVDNYVVYRNGDSDGDRRATVSKLGYFTDFGLTPNTEYKYRVAAFNKNGEKIAESAEYTVKTTNQVKVKSDYKVLALAFDPKLGGTVPSKFAGAVTANGVSVDEYYNANLANKRVSQLDGSLVISGDPGMPNEFNDGVAKHKVKNEFLQYVKDMFKLASNRSINIEAYQNKVITLDQYPPAVDARFQQNDAAIVEMICFANHCSTKGCTDSKHVGKPSNVFYDVGCHGGIDYNTLVTTPYDELGGYSIVDLIEKGDIDFVWIMGGPPLQGFGENTLLGNRGIGNIVDGSVPYGYEAWLPKGDVKCSRSFFLNIFCADQRLFDGYIHMFEGIMTSITDANRDNWPLTYTYNIYKENNWDPEGTPVSNEMTVASFNLWGRFRATDQQNGRYGYDRFAPAAPGNANVGSSHFPPNAPRAYDYAWNNPKTWEMSSYVNSCADDWYSYPNLPSDPVFKKIGAYDYGAYNAYMVGTVEKSMEYNGMSYHIWWFNHLPHNPGVTDGKLNNWWYYIYDFNRFNGSTITYEVTGFPAQPPTVYTPIKSEHGTDTASGSEWGYWHSNNHYGKHAALTMVNKNDASGDGNVKYGNYSLKADINGSKFGKRGWNEIFYPVAKNAGWDLAAVSDILISIKPGDNFNLVVATNPVIRLCMDSGNKVEFVPKANGYYANLFSDNSYKSADGWYNFTIPTEGSSTWERNIVGYVDPSLSEMDKARASNDLKNKIMKNVNYIEIAIGSTIHNTTTNHTFSVYIDGLMFKNSLGIWVPREDMTLERSDSVSVGYNNRIYTIGGYNSSGVSTTSLQVYYPSLNKWVSRAEMSSPRGEMGAAVLGDRIYVVGGVANGSYLSGMEEYITTEDRWIPRASMSAPRYGLGLVEANGRLYAIGGTSSSNNVVGTVEEYDPSKDEWVPKRSMLTPRTNFGIAVVDGMIYAIGGMDNSYNRLKTVEVYDPVEDKWTPLADMPTARMGLTCSVVNGRIYAIGGNESSTVPCSNKVEEYNPVSGAWIIKQNMITGRNSLSSASAYNRIYAIGGNAKATSVYTCKTVEEFIP